MRMLRPLFTLLSFALVAGGAVAGDADWPRFRGPNGQGIASEARIPTDFGPDRHVRWKTPVPPGHSSPVIWGDRVFLTAADPTSQRKLTTLALRCSDGAFLWRQYVESDRDGVFHALNHPASSTPAVDERRVYVYFGTCGLVCYDHEGKLVWERRLPTPRSKYGMATSPIIVGDTVILALDGDDGSSRLLAVRRDTGETAWEQSRPLFKAGWSTPMLFAHDGIEDLIVLGSQRLTAYDPTTGEERWWAGGFPAETVSVPVTGDGLLFASGAALGGRGDEQLDAAATWKTTLEAFDQNRDGQIQREEMTDGFAFIQRPELPRDHPGYGLPVRNMDDLLRIFDRDKSRVISQQEWMDAMAGFAAYSHPYLAALRPPAMGNARTAHMVWETRRGIPETPSPLWCRGRLYLLRDGGLLTCLRAATGEELFRERIGAAGQYIASPIVAGDKLVAASVAGVVTLVQASDEFRVLARNEFGESIFATPAAVGDTLYVRTTSHLYAVSGDDRAP